MKTSSELNNIIFSSTKVAMIMARSGHWLEGTRCPRRLFGALSNGFRRLAKLLTVLGAADLSPRGLKKPSRLSERRSGATPTAVWGKWPKRPTWENLQWGRSSKTTWSWRYTVRQGFISFLMPPVSRDSREAGFYWSFSEMAWPAQSTGLMRKFSQFSQSTTARPTTLWARIDPSSP